MAETEEEPTDMIRGVYRRQYAGFLRGRRINSVTLEAEAWFWRLHAVADDFGNLDGDEQLTYVATLGRRRISPAHVSRLIAELVMVGLLSYYEVRGDKFLHINGFMELQPAGKNGKRTKRYPASVGDTGETVMPKGESGCIQNNPKESCATTNHYHNHNHSDIELEARAAPETFTDVQIYEGYPRKIARDDALNAIKRARTKLSTAGEPFPSGFLMEKVKLFAECRKGQDPQFTPHPATWFNKGRYNDDPSEWNVQNGKHQTQRAKPTAAERGEFAEPERDLPLFKPRVRAAVGV